MKKILFPLAAITLLSACSATNKESNGAPANSGLSSGITTANFDHTVRPQDDLFRHVNGTWLDTTEIPSDKSNYGSFTVLADNARKDMRAIIEASARIAKPIAGSDAQKVGDLYNSYINADVLEGKGLSPLQNELTKIDAIDDKNALAAYFADAQRIGSDSPFGFYINNDSKQPDRYTTFFVHSGLGLPDRDYYLKDDDKSVKIRQAYIAHIETMFSLAGFDTPSKAAQGILALETKIAEAHWPRVDRRNRDLTYNKYTTGDLKKLAPDFNWLAFLDSAGLSGEKTTIIRTPSFYEKFNQIFVDTSLEHWKTYQRWQLLSSYASLLSSALDTENFAFYGTTLQGTQEQEARWKRAVGAVNNLLGEMVGKVYVEKHFKPEAKARMVELVENLREAYRQSITDLDWMSDETKKQALVKLDKFRPKIGYPDKWRDYSALTIDKEDLVGNFIRARIFNYETELNKLGKPIDRDEWFMTPQTVNAYYNPSMNEIVFPAAILQPPFFNMDAEDAVNYGGIGAVIGHEMGHGFDDQGAKSDGDGVLRNWWTDQDLTTFQERTAELAKQYDAFEVLPGEMLNGKFTLGENIGDLGGLTIAYKAYKLSLKDLEAPKMDGYTGEQRLFIGWAQVWARKYREENLRQRITTDPHSPSEFRTNGVVRNMPEFVEAFDVKESDKLFLPKEQRVKIW